LTGGQPGAAGFCTLVAAVLVLAYASILLTLRASLSLKEALTRISLPAAASLFSCWLRVFSKP
jgi:hypothetical protein